MIVFFQICAISIVPSQHRWKLLKNLLLIKLVFTNLSFIQILFQSIINCLVGIFFLFFNGFLNVRNVKLRETLDNHLIKQDNLNFVESFINVFGLVRRHLVLIVNSVLQNFSLLLNEAVVLTFVSFETGNFLSVRIVVLEDC